MTPFARRVRRVPRNRTAFGNYKPDLLDTLLQRLPEKNRCLLLLREIDGYSPARLCEVTRVVKHGTRARVISGAREAGIEVPM